jgi:branched-chain amino acid transport system permease protein
MTEFLQLLVGGIALGARYSLVALGFVVIFRSTKVINFAQGGLVVLGAYFTYNAHQTWGLSFWPALLLGMVGTAIVGAVVERVVLRRMVGQPTFTIIMITIGLLFIVQELVTSIWGSQTLDLGDPWGIRVITQSDVVISVRDLWTIALTAAVLAAFFLFFRYTKFGVAMRATAIDQEAALAQGISVSRVFAVSWAIAGAVAALAGATLAAGPGNLTIGVGDLALAAFPAVILGGLDSPIGALLGGMVVGITQVLTAGYQPRWFPSLGAGFNQVMPYLVMVAILLVRPYGVFGTRDVRRI